METVKATYKQTSSVYYVYYCNIKY